jgi:hypothetical protein
MRTGSPEFLFPLEQVLREAGNPFTHRRLGRSGDREITVVTPPDAERKVDIQGDLSLEVLAHETVS